MSKFQKNAIIAGCINSYCLVCECFFETEEETFSHIKGEEHETRLMSYPHLEKYGNNCIRKVKAGYFCEHCTLLMATAAKVNLHIAEKLHYYNKGNSLLKRSGSVLTAFDDVVISESAWHSFADDACAMCDAEFDDGDEHKKQRAHVLKLLQNKVQFGEDNNIYRMIGKNYFQCLTCNTMPNLNTLDDHFKGVYHKQMYLQCQENKKKFDLENLKKKVITKTDIKKETVQDKVNVVITNIETIAGKPVDIIEESNKTIQSKTNVQQKPDIQPTITKKDVKEDSKKTNKSDNTPQSDNVNPQPKPTPSKKPADSKNTKTTQKEDSTDPASYAKDNKLLFFGSYSKNTNAFCITCEKKFPSSLRGMKEHVQGRDHINKTAKAASKPPLKKTNLEKKPFEQFVTSVCTFNNTLDNDTVINETICIAEKSCHLLTKIGCRFAEYKCQICLVNLSEDDLEDHCQTAKHEKGMRQTPIILGLKNEFVREVRPDAFHCGYCNLMISGWASTSEHLKTAEHKTSAGSCNRRLEIHLPVIEAHKNNEKIQAAFFEMFVNHMRIG